MSSWGSGGGSASGTTGGMANFKQSAGLGLSDLVAQLSNQQGNRQGAAIRPGQENQLSPQQRFADVMRQYGGGQ